MNTEFKLLIKRDADGTETRAVEVRIEVPEGICWEALGSRMASAGLQFITEMLLEELPTPQPIKEPIVYQCPPHDWAPRQSGIGSWCRRCGAKVKV